MASLAGEDVVLRLPVDAATLLAGGSRKIAITRAAACPCCQDGGDPDCVCSGVGRVKVRETVRVAVPAGARSGARLRLAGKGTAGLCGLPDGDLFLVLDPAPVEGFRREGADLFGVIDVDARLARAGGVLQVRVPRGTVRVTVPAGTKTGRRFRLRGQGLPVWGGQGNGDLFLDVETC
ncbi:MAG: hypothetical protein H6704_09340 [Myxococcales bacterium]|nr:hypothetical protein [Myxococcales bacterium]